MRYRDLFAVEVMTHWAVYRLSSPALSTVVICFVWWVDDDAEERRDSYPCTQYFVFTYTITTQYASTCVVITISVAKYGVVPQK